MNFDTELLRFIAKHCVVKYIPNKDPTRDSLADLRLQLDIIMKSQELADASIRSRVREFVCEVSTDRRGSW